MDFAEGWGLYVEKLGIRMGLYEDPMSLFGHYYVGKERLDLAFNNVKPKDWYFVFD